MKRIVGVLGIGIGLFVAGSAGAQQSAPATGVGITRLVITKRQVAYGGASFGSAGPYEIVAGTAYGELDPHAASNTGIVNVNLAPVNAQGHVEYSVDYSGSGQLQASLLASGFRSTKYDDYDPLAKVLGDRILDDEMDAALPEGLEALQSCD
jgi:hypothetical protein